MSQVYDEILNSSNIQNVLEHYGLQIHKNKCTCPFHNDKNPSMSIHQGRGIAKCFACGAGGNAISFIHKYENEINHNQINMTQAMQKAIDIQGLNIVIPNTRETPFTEENIANMKMISICATIMWILMTTSIINAGIIYIFAIWIMYYIFKYGYELQLESDETL